MARQMERTSRGGFVRGIAVFVAAAATWILSADCSSGIVTTETGNPSGTPDAAAGGSSSSGSVGSSSSSGAAIDATAPTATHDAAAPPVDAGTAGCAAGLVTCSGACTNTSVDALNCGACGTHCATGQVCNSGVCGCRTGQTACSGTCVDTTSDANNCGACATACAAGMVCSQSKCASGCAGTLKLCGSSCVDTSGSSLNCGTCGHACPTDESCGAGTCLCPTGEGACGTAGACVDITSSVAHCGGCTACATGASCVAGACACPAGESVCNGICVNTNTDPNNCGACGSTCNTAGNQCLFGGCINPTSVSCPGTAMNGDICTANLFDVIGQYWINNNQWGVPAGSAGTALGSQCAWSSCETGDLVGWGTNWMWANGSGGVKTYVSVVFGWQYGMKVLTTGLPIQLTSTKQVNCGWAFTLAATGTLDVSYDTWLHTVDVTTQPNDGSNATPSEEVMIWVDSAGGAGPIGAVVAPGITLAGTTWDLHMGPGGASWPVYSYVRKTGATTTGVNMMVFYADLVSRGYIPNTRFLSSVQAGTEVFNGSGTLTTNGFYCRVQ